LISYYCRCSKSRKNIACLDRPTYTKRHRLQSMGSFEYRS